MAGSNLLATLEQTLRQTRATRSRLAGRLAELEMEAETLRAEVVELDRVAAQTEASIVRLMSSMLSTGHQNAAFPSDAEIEAALKRDALMHAPLRYSVSRHKPRARTDIEATSDRFSDRTIPQAATLILREAGEPLHVNEIFNRLLEGGFQFNGQNPTISIAVSLNRNGRFRKVAPGTFDLMIRDASRASGQ